MTYIVRSRRDMEDIMSRKCESKSLAAARRDAYRVIMRLTWQKRQRNKMRFLVNQLEDQYAVNEWLRNRGVETR